ncbi:ATP-binding protein [Aquimarina sp. D1M17]|uniref:hybrid sensor histidine kinase/response regulator transcription factor n=1 Tax=Aquimarina acroporae TaxID=2937283 RepID=UPI0020BEE559|nr:hybrid sensor histidine kinase/response regulator transcription factor [Aquimarina acroporae]MCK8524394.1 ATP-binding protein [Aquimarina acroporae]
MKYNISILVWVIHFFAISQEYNFNNFIHLSVSEGLSQSTVLAVEQDRLGQIWIGTRDGLNKYNGEEITVYRTSPNDSTTLSNNDILSILEDSEGNIWVGTYNGLNRFSPKEQKFTRYFYSTEKNTNQHFSTRTIKEIDSNHLWMGTSSGLFIYQKDKAKFIEITDTSGNESQISNSTILEIFQDKNDSVWIGTSNGLYLVNSKDFSVEKFDWKIGDNIKNIQVQAINKDVNGNLLLGTKHNGLLVYNIKKSIFYSYNEIENSPNIIPQKDIRKLRYDNSGNLWVGTYNGLFIIKKDQSITNVVTQPGNPKSLSKNSIKEIFLDRNGSMWIGTYYGGINMWNPNNTNFNTFYDIRGPLALHLGVVSSIVEDQQDKFYFATEGQGIKVNYSHGKSDEETTKSLNTQLINTNIKSILLQKNKLWVGTLKSGVYRYDLESKTFDQSIIIEKINAVLKDKPVYAIKAMDHCIAFGTFGHGVYIYNRKTGGMNQITITNSQSHSITNVRIRTMLFDDDKNLWIGTDKGLNKVKFKDLNTPSPEILHFLYEQKTFYGYNIISLFQNNKGDIFVGTKERGVLQLNKDTFEAIDFNLRNSKITSAYSIVEDDQYNLWVGCNLGMVKYNISQQKSTIYDQSEWFMGNEFINNSYLKSRNGNLYFGGTRGVSFFNPKQVKESNFDQKVILSKFKINGKPIDENISYLDKILLNHNQNSFSINFALPNFVNSSNHKYAYRLLGLNDDWKFTNNHEVSYTIQKPGNYIFEVKEANNENIWNKTTTILPITLDAALWKTPVAYILYVIVIALILYVIYNNMRAKIILAHKLNSERQERIQQRKINQSKLEFFTNISHDFRTPLTLILAPLQQVIENYKGNKDVFNKLQVIEKNASQLLKLTNELLDFRAFENHHTKLLTKNENIVKFVEGIYKSFEEYAEVGNYTYTFESIEHNIHVYYDQTKLEKVFFNIISNAFKYTQKGGIIRVKISQDQDHVTIEIADNGKGINKQFIDKIFDKYYEVASDIEYQKHFNQGSGIGLFIAKKAIDLHKGLITVDSKQGAGSIFEVVLKKGRNHLEDNEISGSSSYDPIEPTIIDMAPSLDHHLDAEFKNILIPSETDTILVVEDNDQFRQYLIDLLKEFYGVIYAIDGEDAYRKALKYSPNLIISDVIMPKMTGIELCTQLKEEERTSHIPIILLTSRSLQIHKLEGLESGADAYFEKPFDIKEFLLVIKNFLGAKKRLKEQLANNTGLELNDNLISLDDKLFYKAMKIIENHIGNPSFDIASFCSELGLSRTMLFIKVKEWTNLTPKEFILSMRMKKATQLLEQTECSIAEIGYKVGFRDPKYFSKAFKKHFKKTPTEYAEKFGS